MHNDPQFSVERHFNLNSLTLIFKGDEKDHVFAKGNFKKLQRVEMIEN